MYIKFYTIVLRQVLLLNPSQSVDIILDIWESFLQNIINANTFMKCVWKEASLAKHNTFKEEY